MALLVGGAANGCGADAAPAGADCGGLGCKYCSDQYVSGPLCASTQPCAVATDCASLPPHCDTNLGTFTLNFDHASCLGGYCAYVPIRGGCNDGTSCSTCASTFAAQDCTFQRPGAACASCCVTRWAANDYAAAVFGACACGAGGPCATACSTSTLCGGAGPVSDACVVCLKSTLTDGGACVASSAFQASCIHANSYCRSFAECLVAGCFSP
jgi:hypothetical protein